MPGGRQTLKFCASAAASMEYFNAPAERLRSAAVFGDAISMSFHCMIS